MNTIVMKSERLGETMEMAVLRSGLHVAVMQRTGGEQVYASLNVRYGSADRHAVWADGQEVMVPDGVQHFLEHMVLARPDGSNSYGQFQKRSASMSAYTTPFMTSYQFFCTERLEENLCDLLDMVQTPYFPADLVDAERKVIEQEIGLYEQDESSLMQNALLAALYGEDHPLATDVLGTAASIRRITPEVLERCHELFYHPQNCFLLVIGDVETERVLACAEAHQASREFGDCNADQLRLQNVLKQTADGPKLAIRQAPVSLPAISFGYKEEALCRSFEEMLYMEQVTQVAFEAAVGRSSLLQRELAEAELIEGELYIQTEVTEQHAYVWVAGYSADLAALQERVEQALQGAVREGLDPEAFRRARNASLMQYLRDFDDLYALGPRVSQNLVRSFPELEIEQVLSSLTPEMARLRLQELLAPERTTVSILYPEEE